MLNGYARFIWRSSMQKRNARKHDVHGQMLTTSELAAVAGIPIHGVFRRLNAGWTIAEIISTPTITPKHVAIGDRFGKLVVVAPGPIGNHNKRRWLCRCDCGQRDVLCREDGLKIGDTASCGCLRRQTAKQSGAQRRRDMVGFTMESGAVVIGLSANIKKRKHGTEESLWTCRCACGSTFDALVSVIIKGQRRWCGYSCPNKRNAVVAKRQRKCKRFDVNGEMLSLREMASIAGASPNAISLRMKRLGMTPVEAIAAGKGTRCRD